MIKNTFYSICFLFLGTVACNNSQPKMMDKKYKKIDALVQSVLEKNNYVGVSVVVVKGNEIVYAKGFGVTSLETHEPLQTYHNFHVASVSKTFVATAVMQLVEQGKIKLDNPLVKHLPYCSLQGVDFQKITIKQMLNHSSGFPDTDDYEWEKSVADDGAAERYVRSLGNEKLLCAPNTAFHYSNIAYDVLGDLIAKISGVSFEKYVKDSILTPLKMTESSFYYPEIKHNLRTMPHVGIPATVSKIYPYNRMHAPSSTLNTSALELANWAIANLNKGVYKDKKILSPANHALMMTPTFKTDRDGEEIGLSWFIRTIKGVKHVEHFGGDTGYGSVLTLLPEKNMGIIILFNSEEVECGDVRDKIRDILLTQ
jgi:CubicO group peptidase (beta-lactamase class C family)